MNQIRSTSVFLQYVSKEFLEACSYKTYVEPDAELFDDGLKPIIERLDLTVTETYVSKQGITEGVNLRLESKDKEELVNIFSHHDYIHLLSVLDILPKNVLPFSLALRYLNYQIVGKTCYFYPTCKNSNKYKATSISDKNDLLYLCNNISTLYNLTNESFQELRNFFIIGTEFRGIGISLYSDVIITNIYFKVSLANLKNLLANKIRSAINIDYHTILISLKIRNSHIMGYRLYYKGEFGKVCCGWGEVLSD